MLEGCDHCGFQGALLKVGDSTAQSHTEDHQGYGEVTIEDRWLLSRCPNCDRATLDRYTWVDPVFDSEDDVRLERIYPTLLAKGALPPGVQKQFDSAHRVKAIDPSFYAVGVRRMLEAVCAEQGATASTLEKQIAALVAAEKLPPVFAGMAKQLRTLGNWGAHNAATEVEDDDVPLIEEFADAILDYLYWAPAKLASVEAALDKRKKEGRTA
jgi:hypothetical protein